VLGRQRLNHAERLNLRVKDKWNSFKSLSGGAHPRAQGVGMRGRLVVGMVCGVGNSLAINQTAEKEKAKHQPHGDRSKESPTHSRKY
jgi:hypothetical protein